MTRPRVLAAVAMLSIAGCGVEPPGEGSLGEARQAEIMAPLPAAYCTMVVQGIGNVDTENDYLPHVITCENGGANLHALKAQAIAARSVAYYDMATYGSICDGQGCQVYSCGAAPQAVHYQAVAETSGMYLSYGSLLTYGFYVAGDSNTSPPGCIGVTGSTEGWVTYNEGKTGVNVEQTALGYMGPPGFGQNRGCMGQWGARCLENNLGYDFDKILRFYYGADIGILQAPGPCVTPPNAPPNGVVDVVSCDAVEGWAQDPDEPSKSIDVHVYFNGPAGDPNAVSVPVTANIARNDLCAALGSCEHAFRLQSPLSLHDGQPHAVHAYGIDTAGGNNPALANAPGTMTCAPEVPPGVRRHVKDPASFDAWKFNTFWQVLRIDAATLVAIKEWDALGDVPLVVQANDGTPEVWLIDGGRRRHVPDPAAFDAWSFTSGAIQSWPASDVYALPQGSALRPRPILVAGPDPGIFLIDDEQGAAGSSTGSSTTGGSSSTGGWGESETDEPAGTAVALGCACRAAGTARAMGSGRFGMLTVLFAALLLARRRRGAFTFAHGAGCNRRPRSAPAPSPTLAHRLQPCARDPTTLGPAPTRRACSPHRIRRSRGSRSLESRGMSAAVMPIVFVALSAVVQHIGQCRGRRRT